MKLRILFSISILTACFVLTIKAQVSCALQVETYRGKIFDLSKDKSFVYPVLDGAEITLENKKTKKVLKGIAKKGIVVFQNVFDGEYSITAKEKNSAPQNYDLTVDCNGMDETGKIFEDVLLWEKGKTIKSRSPGYWVIGNTDSDLPSANSGLTIAGNLSMGKTTNLIQPKYPPAARAVNASGTVNVLVLINELGRVVSATATSGHPLLRSAAVKAARATRFSPTILDGMPVRVSGTVVYNFTPQ